jgi:hypothetical protein
MIKRLIQLGYWLMVIVLFIASLYLILQHRSVLQAASLFSGVASHYDRLENEVSLLSDQRDQTHFLKSQQRSIRLEQLEAYVVPHHLLLDRINSFTDTMQQVLQADNVGSTITLERVDERGTLQVDTTTVTTHEILLKTTVHRSDVPRLATMFDTSGMTTLYDVFTPHQRQALLEIVLNEDHGALPSLEVFFATSLLDYSAAPNQHTEQLQTFISSAQNIALVQEVLRNSRLPTVTAFLQKALSFPTFEWPVPLMQVQSIALQQGSDGYLEGTITLLAFTQ